MAQVSKPAVSFEILQKALAGRIPIVRAVLAPSSLAVDFARESGQTVVGFLRGDAMNIYAGAKRVRPIAAWPACREAEVCGKS